MCALSRNPSPFGLIVVSSGPSPAKRRRSVVAAQIPEPGRVGVEVERGRREDRRPVDEPNEIVARPARGARRSGRPSRSARVLRRDGGTIQPRLLPLARDEADADLARHGQVGQHAERRPRGARKARGATLQGRCMRGGRQGERHQVTSPSLRTRARVPGPPGRSTARPQYPSGPCLPLKTSSSYVPTGDQPQAIATLADGLRAGERYQTLLGATGTGKTATMAWIIEQVQKPALVIAHNKTLAAQLCNEFREFFPAQRGRVLRLLLRLLPARGVRPAGRPLHREGLLAERRHRAAPALGDVVALHAQGRDRRRVGLVHLRARLAGGVARPAALPRGRERARSRRGAAQAHRVAVRPQRHGARPRALPRQGRHPRGPARERRDGVPRSRSSATRSSRSRTSTR